MKPWWKFNHEGSWDKINSEKTETKESSESIMTIWEGKRPVSTKVTDGSISPKMKERDFYNLNQWRICQSYIVV